MNVYYIVTYLRNRVVSQIIAVRLQEAKDELDDDDDFDDQVVYWDKLQDVRFGGELGAVYFVYN